MTRYVPSRNYLVLGIIALSLAGLSTWIATRWLPAALPVLLFIATAALNFYLALRPTIEIGAQTIVVGDREYLWSEIEAIQRTGWVSPLIVWLVLKDGGRVLLVYPGALEGSRRLSEDMNRRLNRVRELAASRTMVAAGVQSKKRVNRQPFLNAADEADVLRLFNRLKTVGHLGQDDK
jgi:hypothetical protein